MSGELAAAREALPRTLRTIEQGVAEGLHLGAQLYVSLGGSPVADFGLGEARPGVPLDRDAMLPWYSASKASTPIAVAQQWQRGRFDLDDPVVRFIPEFGVHGKERITIRHLLTLTAGFPAPPGSYDPRLTWEEQVARYCATPLREGWEVGKQAAYGPSPWYILGEIVRRLDGRPYSQYVHEAVMRPLGMSDSWLGLPPDRHAAYGHRIGLMHDTRGERPVPLPAASSAETLAACAPSGGSIGPIRELAFLYELINGRGERNGVRLLEPTATEAMILRQTVGVYDVALRTRVSRCFGLMVDSQGFGRHRSPRAVGHPGAACSVGFADPEYGLAVGFIANGNLDRQRHSRRIDAICSAIYEDLGLASPDAPGRNGDAAPDYLA
jgi:CubicO group peptidase (beta-lactamase class C family)